MNIPPLTPVPLAPLDQPGVSGAAGTGPVPARRSRVSRFGLAAGIVALVAIAGAGLATVLGGSNGASSPEAAVRRLADAAAGEDILAAAQLLPPSEVGSAADLYDLVIKVLQKNDQLGPAGKPLAGVDINVDDLELETTRYGDRVAKVALRDGSFGVKVTAADVDPRIRETQEAFGGPVTDSQRSITVREILDRLESVSDAAAEAGLGEGRISGLYLMTIEQGGRWYVSYHYTVLEYLREALGAELPEFGPRVQGEGQPSPDAWLRKGIAAIDGLDENAIADRLEDLAGQPSGPSSIGDVTSGAINPPEVQAFADYLPLFTHLAAAMNEAFAQFGDGAGSRLDAPDLGFLHDAADRVRGLDISIKASAEPKVTMLSGDRALVSLRQASLDLRIQGEVEGEVVDVTLSAEVYDGRCSRWRLRTLDGRGRPQTGRGDRCTDVFAGTDFPGFFYAAVKTDGAWYVSPVETVVQYARFALEAELAR